MARQLKNMQNILQRAKARLRELLKQSDILEKKDFRYKERDENKRREFQATIATIDPAKVRHLDETGIDNNEEYPYGWSQKGQRAHGTKKAFKSERLSILGALKNNVINASMLFYGTCTRAIFETFLCKILVPTLTPGEVVVLDNAACHKGGSIIEIIEAAGCSVLYLPPYSPDFNPIEHRWAPLKSAIRKVLPSFNHNAEEAALSVFKNGVF